MPSNRRDFVRTAAGLSLAGVAASGKEIGEIPKRKFGKTGVDVTIMGLGGARVGTMTDEDEAIKVIRHARAIGINYFDNASAGAYGVGQRRYGTAFGKDNKDIFYTTKSRHRTYLQAELDLNQALGHYKRDWVDLFQVHNVMTDEDINFVFGPRGLMEMIEKAKKDGKIRFVGFTGHQDPKVLKKMVGMYDWDTILTPLSVTDGAREASMSFEKTTLPVAVEKGLGIQAMKTTGVGAIEKEGVTSLEESLSYVWSLPIHVAILGCTSIEQLEADARIAVATGDKRLSDNQMDTTRQKWAKADFSKLEPWKVDHSKELAAIPKYQGD